MITNALLCNMKIEKKDFLEACKVVESYRKQVNNAIVPHYGYRCICCKSKMIALMHPENGVKDVLKQEQEIWIGGTVARVSFGYGSRLDTYDFYMAICDACTTDLQREDVIVDIHKIRKTKNEHAL